MMPRMMQRSPHRAGIWGAGIPAETSSRDTLGCPRMAKRTDKDGFTDLNCVFRGTTDD